MIRAALSTAVLGLGLMAFAARAHEFMVLPAAPDAPEGETLSVALTMTESWIRPDRAPPPETVRLERIDAAGRVPVPVTPAERSLDAAVPGSSGPFLLSATMQRDRVEKPRVPQGVPEPEARMTRTAVFSKAFVNLAPGSAVWSVPVGTRMEIVPLANPATLKPGDSLPVRVLFDGRPVAARVQATFDAGGAEGHGFVFRGESGADGLATIPVDRPGLWIVRARHGLDEKAAGYLHYAGGANLLFRVAAGDR